MTSETPANHGGPRPSRGTIVLVGLGVALVSASVARMLVGDTFGWPGPEVRALRVDRLMIGLSVGAALAVSGTLLQALLRNPLASPYILGVSSGAGVGVMLTSYVGGFAAATFADIGANHAGALVGALGAMFAVYLLSQKRGFVDPVGLLLVGVVINAINGAVIMFINYMTPHGRRADIAVWMMGYFNNDATRRAILLVAGVTAVGTVAAALLGRSMDVATLRDDEAASVGLNLPVVRLLLAGLAGVLTAGTVVLAGPISFVGLICPHLVRVMVGPGHRTLVIGSAMAGAALLVWADVLIKVADVGQGLMPIGILTAIIGGPLFLWMLRPRLGRGVDV